ncbi:MAG: DJ-1/PfpI family protein [Armatimonadota bacterium]
MQLRRRRIGIVIADGYHEHELWFPYYRFREEGAEVVVAGPETGVVHGEGRHGRDGLPAEITHTVEQLARLPLDALYLPGGVWAPLTLRAHQPTLDLVCQAMADEVVVAAICHASWVLVSAGVVDGRRIACPSDMAVDVTNAGGVYVDEPCARDGNLVTAVYFGYLPEQFRMLLPTIVERPPRAERA